MHRVRSHGPPDPPGGTITVGAICEERRLRALVEEGVLVTDLASLLPVHASGLADTMGDLVRSLDRVDGTHVPFALPQIYLAALDEGLLTTVSSYLASPPALTGVHIRRDVGEEVGGIKRWHLDSEDARVVRLISYLEDVDLNNGPFEFVPEHAARRCAALQIGGNSGPPPASKGDEPMAFIVSPAHWRSITGPPSTCVLVDTARLFHRTRPHGRTRLALTFTYTTPTPTHPEVRRNPGLDHLLSEFQAACFFAATPEEATS
jgi:hypothetical protein